MFGICVVMVILQNRHNGFRQRFHGATCQCICGSAQNLNLRFCHFHLKPAKHGFFKCGQIKYGTCWFLMIYRKIRHVFDQYMHRAYDPFNEELSTHALGSKRNEISFRHGLYLHNITADENFNNLSYFCRKRKQKVLR